MKKIILLLSVMVSFNVYPCGRRNYIRYKFKDKLIEKQLKDFFDENTEEKRSNNFIVFNVNVYNPGNTLFVTIGNSCCGYEDTTYAYLKLKGYKCLIDKECLENLEGNIITYKNRKKIQCVEREQVIENDGEAWEILFDFENRKIIEGEKYW